MVEIEDLMRSWSEGYKRAKKNARRAQSERSTYIHQDWLEALRVARIQIGREGEAARAAVRSQRADQSGERQCVAAAVVAEHLADEKGIEARRAEDEWKEERRGFIFHTSFPKWGARSG